MMGRSINDGYQASATPKQIIRKLRVTMLIGQGAALAEVCKYLEISEATWHRWVAQYSGMKAQIDRVVLALADIQPEERAVLAVRHASVPCRGPRSLVRASDCRQPRYEETYPAGWPGPYQRSADATRPGDNTLRIMPTTGAVSHTRPGDRVVPGWGRSKR
jgi:hypothetical protein